MTRVALALAARCRGCHHDGAWRLVLEMDAMPLAGQFCESPDAARDAQLFPLTWVQCLACELVQVLEDIDDTALFQTYSYASSTVPGLVRHFDEYAAFLAQRYGDGPIRLLEIGCNDGVLLCRLPAAYKRVGVDPSNVAGAAPPGPYTLVNTAFTLQTASDVPMAGTFDVVTASNCLAHISDLRDVFIGIERVLRSGGHFWIEVHDLEATLNGGQWDTIYHEHKVEWSIGSLTRCLAPLGLRLLEVQRLPLHGGLLRAGFVKEGRKFQAEGVPGPGVSAFEALRQGYRGRRDTPVYHALRSAVDRGAAVGAYGASGRANVWLNQVPEMPFRYIIDDSPLRSRRWMPRVGTPIVPSSHLDREEADVCLITAWNYADDIRRKHPTFRGQWLQTFGA